MQSKTTRGVRHLLVSTGVISLVLSVAAPAALADAEKSKGKSDEKKEHVDSSETGTGTKRVLVCHNGAVLEVDDDGGGDLGGHGKHGDPYLGLVGDESEEVLEAIKICEDTPDGGVLDDGDELINVCRGGILIASLESEVLEDDVEPVRNDEDELTCPGGIIVGGDKTTVCVDGVLTEVAEIPEGAVPAVEGEDGLTCPGEIIPGGGDKVEVCHEGVVIEIAAEALEQHLSHGDAEMLEGVTCPVILDEEIEEIDIEPVVVLDDPVVVVEVPVKDPSATPVPPIPPAQPRPVVNISTDTVTKPVVPAQPASPAAAPKADQNEVLGAVTTRTPTPGVGALDPGTHTAASITALAATGADGTKVLAAAGVILLLSGFGLQVSGRRRMRSAMVEA